ncbi:MAG: sodium:solute symporter [bacterium]
MEFSGLDYFTLAAYLVVVLIFGSYFSRQQRSSMDYFLGGKNLPWWAVAFSIVAAETSTLTFISIPGLAYISNLGFLQLALGYVVGRAIISFVLLPAYARGKLWTAYELLGNRFGTRLRSFTTLVFQFTRLLADGVRLFATAIPLSIITGWNYPTSILVIGLVTILYTYFGGIKAIVWLDLLQMSIYFASAILAGFMILQALPEGWNSVVSAAAPGEKFRIFSLGFEGGLREFFSINYTLITGLLGGAFLSMASHGTDQLIVQKLFSCRNLKDSQKALITSGILVFIQFAVFLMVGVLLYAYYGGVAMRSDEIFPRFIVEGLPAGLSGLIIAGIFAAAMSTLSASLNALASTSMNDLIKPRLAKDLSESKELLYSRLITLLWGIVFIAGAMFFKDKENPVVELGLGIASFTYGGMLGVFFLGILSKKAGEEDALVGIWTAIFFMTWVIGVQGAILTVLTIINLLAAIWIFARIRSSIHRIAMLGFGGPILLLILFVVPAQIAWPWYVLIGTIVTIAVANTVASLGKSQ